MTQASPVVALNSQWLDSTLPLQGTFTAQGSSTLGINTTNCVNTNLTYWPNYQPGIWWYPYEGPARPIRLGLSEIARLKAAAKRDAKLKAILAKFTDLIEVAVDFE